MTSVTVQRFPFGCSQFVDGLAEVSDQDVLTITYGDAALAAHGPWQVFESGTWRSAACYDHQGKVERLIESRSEFEQRDAIVQRYLSEEGRDAVTK